MLKLLIISHALVQEVSQKRWRQIADKGYARIRILIPEHWQSSWFGDTIQFDPEYYCGANIEVVPCPTTSTSNWGRYLIKNLKHHLLDFRPHVIFCIHEEGIWQLQQTIIYKRLFAPRAKLVYFSMMQFARVPLVKKPTPKEIFKKIYCIITWRNIRQGTDGCLVHYPAIRERMRKEGYRKPVLLQTQLGVDPNGFCPNPDERKSVRRRLKLNKFTIGYAGRLVESKGVMDLAKAVESLRGDWNLLLVGDGDCRERVEALARNHGWADRLRITGYVSAERVASLMRAMDAFVMASRNTADWVDTFPLVVAQAMATSLPGHRCRNRCDTLPARRQRPHLS